MSRGNYDTLNTALENAKSNYYATITVIVSIKGVTSRENNDTQKIMNSCYCRAREDSRQQIVAVKNAESNYYSTITVFGVVERDITPKATTTSN